MADRQDYLDRLERELRFLDADERAYAVERMASRISSFAERHPALREDEILWALEAPELVAAWFRNEVRGTEERPRDPGLRHRPFPDFLKRFGFRGDVHRNVTGAAAVPAGTTVFLRFRDADLGVEASALPEVAWSIAVSGDAGEVDAYAPAVHASGHVLVIDDSGSVRPDLAFESAAFTLPAGPESLVAESMFGDIEVIGLGFPVFASSKAGLVIVDRIAAAVTVETVSGNIEAADIAGSLAVRSVSGDAALSAIRGDVNIETASGNVSVRQCSAFIEAGTSSGSIAAELGPEGRGASLSASFGGIILVVDPDGDWSIDAETVSGGIDFSFGERIVRQAKRFRTGFGAGTRPVTLRTGAGPIRIEVLPT